MGSGNSKKKKDTDSDSESEDDENRTDTIDHTGGTGTNPLDPLNLLQLDLTKKKPTGVSWLWDNTSNSHYSTLCIAKSHKHFRKRGVHCF